MVLLPQGDGPGPEPQAQKVHHRLGGGGPGDAVIAAAEALIHRMGPALFVDQGQLAQKIADLPPGVHGGPGIPLPLGTAAGEQGGNGLLRQRTGRKGIVHRKASF